MTVEFHLPDIGEGIAEAEIVRWLVDIGDSVVEDQAMAEVETDKAVVEMPAPATGRVTKRGGEVGDVVPVGALFVVIEESGSGAALSPAAPAHAAADGLPDPAGTPEARAEVGEPPDPTGTPEAPADAVERPRGRRPRATPATRRRARELGVDLHAVTATGPGGRTMDADVEAAVSGDGQVEEPPAPQPVAAPVGDVERIAVRGVRRATVESMTRSWRSIPHTVGFHDVDAAPLLDLHRRLKPRAEALTLTAFLVKAAALALVEHPMVNSAFDEAANEIVVQHRRNVAVAVNTGDGLVLPVVRDADRLGLLGIARELARLTEGARTRRIDRADLQGGTFTITNYGPLGGSFGTSIIRPPEAGILGFGRAAERPWVVDGAVVPRPILPMSFASDHRIVDGDLSIGFCLTVRGLLEDPVQLLLGD